MFCHVVVCTFATPFPNSPHSYFESNSISGTIGSAFTTLTSLQHLYVHVPAALVSLARISSHMVHSQAMPTPRVRQHLLPISSSSHSNLDWNDVSGTIGSELTALTSLRNLCAHMPTALLVSLLGC
jgi:hypothetical protein